MTRLAGAKRTPSARYRLKAKAILVFVPLAGCDSHWSLPCVTVAAPQFTSWRLCMIDGEVASSKCTELMKEQIFDF
ncbi:MAG TPA: hypothetical protein PLF25_06785 [Accumulibacter sp.]|nr:hypothetical protein [Accumulibacter sp.]